ncbi:MAG: hypothetical protein QM729_21430 [Solirubrobacterales bacterium]
MDRRFNKSPGQSLTYRPSFKAGPDRVRDICLALDPEHNPRYLRNQQGRGETYCNIFASDVCDLFGVPPSHTQPGYELNANGMVRWLTDSGPEFGWVAGDAKTAQDAAARGHLVLLGYDSKSSKPGHIAVLLPEGTLAQAGAKNGMGLTVASIFGRLPTQYFIQMSGGSHGPEVEA